MHLHNLFYAFALFKVFYGRLKQLHVVIAGNILIKSRAYALGVSHFAEHSAVGRKYTLNRSHRAVGIEAYVSRCVAVKIHILSCYLSVFGKCLENIILRYKASLAVGNGYGLHLSHLTAGKPR